ncbi:MAG TPA: tRNA pseudouridine(55) synthase TruB [Clostridiaceae bacterium]|nr:tRNA pseudouridine(55) synthase TruB [Clostridiaceae bacterium]
MNGIINVLKPPGMTSFDVVSYLRGLLKQRKIGHTGTLDPGAVGVLPICFGSATKAIDYIMNKNKIYRVELTLGTETDTQDSFGNVINTCEVKVSEQDIINVINSFKGKYLQVPPMYSAIKVNGKKLYELARKGVEIDRNPREVEIYKIEIIRQSKGRVLFDVSCSKGTYMRTLCSDIGKKLGCGAHMSFLVRMAVGNMHIYSALTLEDILYFYKTKQLDSKIIKIDSVLEEYKPVMLNSFEERKFSNGAAAKICGNFFKTGELVRVYSTDNKFIALGEIVNSQKGVFVKVKKFF